MEAKEGKKPAPATVPSPLPALNLICFVFHNLDPYTITFAMDAVRQFLDHNLPAGAAVAFFHLGNQADPNEPRGAELDQINAAWKAVLIQQDPTLKDTFAKHPAWQPLKESPFFQPPQLNADGDPPNEWELVAAGWGFVRFDPASVFTIVAVLTLALGIGANVAVFSIVNTILLRPLPFRQPQQLTWLAANNGVGGLSDQTYRVDAYEEIQRHNQSFQEVTGYVPFFSVSDYKLMGYGEPKPVSGVWVAGNFFSMLGIQPALGRLFTPEECVQGGRPAVLLSHAFWQQQFAANPAIIGQAITLNNQAVTVVGVLPDSFDFGSVFAPGLKKDVFVPAIMDGMRNWGHVLSVLGRLKPGVAAGEAQAEVTLLFSQSKAQHPEWFSDSKTTITGLKEYVSGKLRRALIVLWCAVGLILLIVCVNLANLLLARAAARSKEFALRGALGAGRGRLIRQLLTESLVLASAGTLLGLGLAFAILRYLAHQGSIALPLLSSARVDVSALTWTLLITVAAVVVFGLVPGLKVAGGSLQAALKDAGPGMSAGRKHERLRGAGDLGGRAGLRAVDWRRLAAAQLSKSPGCGPGIPAQPGCRNQSGLRRWR